MQCTACGKPESTGSYCDTCAAENIKGLLSNHWWLTWRGCAAGDRPGETLKQTMERELKALTNP